MITIDGSLFSGSGSIIRQAVAFSGLTGQPIHLVNARVKREKPGLRRQHVRVVEAMCELVNGKARGAFEGSQEIDFYPGLPGLNEAKQQYCWDIESAGSTTMLALAVLPVLAFRSTPTIVEIRGGLFQDFAPSVFHLQHVVLPLLHHMGLEATLYMNRPGYVPRGKGSLSLKVKPIKHGLQPIILEEAGPVQKIWGIALASHLVERRVSHRMAESAAKALARGGYVADITLMEDTSAEQPGAALALFADCGAGVRLGADRAGALGRRSEDIGRYVVQHLLADFQTGATVDRFAADQIIPFAALAGGTSQFLIPQMTDHVQTGIWLARLFFGAEATTNDHHLEIQGVGWSS
ncbi:MAG: RNA 3'-terminal phosphate cyclase [Nitrospirota bacterium]|nr:RNA 3'-terminal phosphate cyclase [Nitrospirota bacterium]